MAARTRQGTESAICEALGYTVPTQAVAGYCWDGYQPGVGCSAKLKGWPDAPCKANSSVNDCAAYCTNLGKVCTAFKTESSPILACYIYSSDVEKLTFHAYAGMIPCVKVKKTHDERVVKGQERRREADLILIHCEDCGVAD